MKKFLSIVSFLVLLSFNAIAGTKVGEIVGQMGTTWNEREGKNETVTMGYELLMNDFLQTGEDGCMILSYVDGTKFTMGPNTEAIIDEFAFLYPSVIARLIPLPALTSSLILSNISTLLSVLL